MKTPVQYACSHVIEVDLSTVPVWFPRHAARRLSCPRCHRAEQAAPVAEAIAPEDFLLEAAAQLRAIRTAKPSLAAAARAVWSRLLQLAGDAAWLAEWAAVTLAELPAVVAQHAAAV